MSDVCVRFAPSPTGTLHVGTARAAIYNWLFARRNKGKFILRIEDTDVARSSEEMITSIIDGLNWLGIDWDEGPIFQSKRLEIYKKYADKLLKDGKAYYCYCTPEQLAERREKDKREKKEVKYDRRCFRISEEERKRYDNEKRPKALRFFVPEGETSFQDIVYGLVKKSNKEIEDFVVLKSGGVPTYNFAVVVDDFEMGVSHVIRGDDHIPNTPKQILLYKALGLSIPQFAHLPLILGEDRSKLSKRHGAVSVTQYREDGILPDALFNFLSLLGWAPGDEREIMSREELLESFTLERINKTAGVFDVQKLEWMNGVYLNELSDEDLLDKIIPFLLEKKWIDKEFMENKHQYLLRTVSLLKKRMRKLSDFVRFGSYFFEDVKEYDPKGVKKHLTKETSEYLKLLINALEKTDNFSKDKTESIFRTVAGDISIKPAFLIHPVRLAVTGMTVGPGLFEIIEVLGKDVVLKRLTNLINYTNSI